MNRTSRPHSKSLVCLSAALAFVFSFARPRPFAVLSFFHLPDPGLSLRFRFFAWPDPSLPLRFRFFICQTHPLLLRFRFFHLPDPPPFAALSFLLFWSNSTTSMFVQLGSKPQQVVSNSHIIKTDHVKCQHQQHHRP